MTPPLRWLPCIGAITPTLYVHYALVLSVLSAATISLYAACLPTLILAPLLLFLKWDVSISGVEPPQGPTLNLHLMLSVSIFHRSRVPPKHSVVGRRRLRPACASATC